MAALHVRLIFQIATALVFYTSVPAEYDVVTLLDMLEYEYDVFFEILVPSELNYMYRIRPALNFGTPLGNEITPFISKLVPTRPDIGCRKPDNEAELQGNIALVERGECTFKEKAIHAEEAGARGIIIYDDEVQSDVYIEMVDDESGRSIGIMAAFLLGQSGYMIKSTLQRLDMSYAQISIPVNITSVANFKKTQPRWVVW